MRTDPVEGYAGSVRVSPLVLLLLLSTACVERRLMIRSEPPGAVVHVNGEEIGRTPTTWRFYHYGKILVETQQAGYEPESRVVHLKPPWYQYPVADFVSDVLVPSRIQDDHELELKLVALTPPEELDEAEIRRRLDELTLAAASFREKATVVPQPDGKQPKSPPDSEP